MINLHAVFLKKAAGLIIYFFWVGLWLLGLGLVLWYPLRWWPGDKLLPVQLINYFMPWLLLALIPAIIIAGLANRPGLIALLALPTLFIIFSYAPLFLPRSNMVLADSGRIKVMSYNIWGHNHNMRSVAAIIHREQPDILLLQEAYSHLTDSLMEELTRLYPDQELYYTFTPGAGQAIISRFPLSPQGTSYEQGRAQKAIVHTPNGDILVWNVHLKQPRYWSSQYDQMVLLEQAIAAVDQPLIVGGDFNTTDQSEIYHMINQHLDNSHWEAGWGFGFSYPANKPTINGVTIPTSMIRIDHIFHSRHFYAYDAKTLSTNGGSDHFPVVADLSLTR